MKRWRIFLGACVAAIAFSAAQADDGTRDVEALNSAKISLVEAIQIAEKQGNGQAIDVEIEAGHKAAAHYEVKVLSDDGKQLTKYKIDANSGNVTETENEPFEKVFTRLQPGAIQAAPISLTRAISTAEQRANGKAIEAEVERAGDQVRYEVKVARTDGSTQEVKVNGSDGKVAVAD
jgi:uncharacterized membrane protein YkoI